MKAFLNMHQYRTESFVIVGSLMRLSGIVFSVIPRKALDIVTMDAVMAKSQ